MQRIKATAMKMTGIYVWHSDTYLQWSRFKRVTKRACVICLCTCVL